MQRTGRTGHAMFRVIAQDSRRTPTSGKVAAYLGNYDPHTKTAVLTKEKIVYYLEHGAQPSERVAKLLKSEGIKLPAWTVTEKKQARSIRHPEKLRRNRPAELAAEPVAEAAPAPAENSEPAVTETTEETPVEVAEAEVAAEPVETEANEEAAAEAEVVSEAEPVEAEAVVPSEQTPNKPE
ncbi:MAG TPA: 30S ribosomal protein S16 [Candidatus Binatia bacterium]|nr:30S ribosomal protein S16 [Candidatus Binatia bacterium]